MFKHGIKRYEESRELKDLEPPIKEYRDILEVYRDSVSCLILELFEQPVVRDFQRCGEGETVVEG